MASKANPQNQAPVQGPKQTAGKKVVKAQALVARPKSRGRK